MKERVEISSSDREKIINQNKYINKETITAHEKLERELRKLGVEIKPTFNLEPPLGWNRTGCYTQNN